jgi:glycerol-3-phosphate dehydrogenase
MCTFSTNVVPDRQQWGREVSEHLDTDLLIIGGGINGVGIARDAAGRGLSVVLCEQGDLGQATSSASSKLLHGGLRYLEHREFKLVRESLAEREVLLRNAPHIVKPMRFVMPHNRKVRPAWMLHAGLILYDRLSPDSSLPGSERFNLRAHPYGAPLSSRLRTGFVYSDCWIDDARLVILTALDAAGRGATILPRTRCESAVRTEASWTATLRDTLTGDSRTVTARAIVNAAGPWVGSLLRDGLLVDTPARLRLVKGSHIVVPRLHHGDQAYVLQSNDRRIVFVLPFEKHYSLIGTTEVPYSSDPGSVHISRAETEYLCNLVSSYFKCPVTPDDVVWSYSGVRSLYDDEAASDSTVTRDYRLEVDTSGSGAPVLNVLGGKLTGYRLLAEQVMARLQPVFPGLAADWTASSHLPGGQLETPDFGTFLEMVTTIWPWLPAGLASDYARRYGSRIHELLGHSTSVDALGCEIGPDLFEVEAQFLVDDEWAVTSDDILWRRTKLGLRQTPESITRLDAWLEAPGAR